MIQVPCPTLRKGKDNYLLKVVPVVKSNQHVLSGGQGLGFTFSSPSSLTLCPKKSPARPHGPHPRARPAKGMVEGARGTGCKVIARCWMTGKVSSPFKFSSGHINTSVDEVPSNLKH